MLVERLVERLVDWKGFSAWEVARLNLVHMLPSQPMQGDISWTRGNVGQGLGRSRFSGAHRRAATSRLSTNPDPAIRCVGALAGGCGACLLRGRPHLRAVQGSAFGSSTANCHTVMNIAATTGPMTKPYMPKTEKPPRVVISTSQSGIWLSLATRSGRGRLSIRPITSTPHTARPARRSSACERVRWSISKAAG